MDGDETFEFKDRDDDSQFREGCSQDETDGVYTTSKYVPKYEDNPWGYGPWRDVSRYFIMDDVNIPDDYFYLRKFRAFHNHDIDLNLMANLNLVSEKDVWRKGAWKTLPQGMIAI